MSKRSRKSYTTEQAINLIAQKKRQNKVKKMSAIGCRYNTVNKIKAKRIDIATKCMRLASLDDVISSFISNQTKDMDKKDTCVRDTRIRLEWNRKSNGNVSQAIKNSRFFKRVAKQQQISKAKIDDLKVQQWLQEMQIKKLPSRGRI